jgi:hypothetical protein
MRTKTLLLTAALSAAGIATSMAQAVYSVNAVGYVNTTLPKGFSLISNPLDNKSGNTIQNLFGSIAGIPANFTVYKFAGGKFATPASFDDISNDFQPPASASLTVVPGEGVFVMNPSATALTVTFVGEVPQGTLSFPVPKGFSIVSSPVPQAGTVSALGYVPAENDTFYQFNTATQKYNTPKSFSLGSWDPSEPTLAVGEAAFLNSANQKTWTRTFSVNQ